MHFPKKKVFDGPFITFLNSLLKRTSLLYEQYEIQVTLFRFRRFVNRGITVITFMHGDRLSFNA